MERDTHERFVFANEELRDFLRRAENLAKGTSNITERDLKALSQRLSNLAPEIAIASRSETLDDGLRKEVGEYIDHLRALQPALEKVRCVMLARKMHLETATRHLNGMRGWVNAYNQTM